MTVTAQIPINRLLGNGINTVFPFQFTILQNADLIVYQDGAEKVEGADYDVNYILGDVGGTITMYVAPFSGSIIILARSTDRTQATDYTPYDAFPAETHEAALDKLTLIAQESYARAQFGLPLAPGGLYWDAKGLRIQSGADPISANHYATKRYVDENSGGGGGGPGFDPALDYTTTGNWINNGSWQWTGPMQRSGVEVATVAQIPNITGKADKTTQILSSDTDVLTVVQPTLADDVTLNPRTNIADGLVKLNGSGLIPPALLPFAQLENLGGYDPALGTPAPGVAGQFYLFTADGTITLKDPDGVDFAADVTAGDRMIYLGNPVAGWYYVAQTGAPGIASQIFYDNTQVPAARQLTAENVQAALDEVVVEYASKALNESISTTWDFTGARPRHQGVDLATVNDTPNLSAYTQRTVNENITGQWSFSVGVSLVGSVWPTGLGNDGQVLGTDGAGQLEWIDSTGGGGMDPTQDYTISGSWNYVTIPTINGVDVATIDLLPPSSYVQRNVNEILSGNWSFTGGQVDFDTTPITRNEKYWSGLTFGGITQPMIGMNSADIVTVGAFAHATNLTNNGDLRLNGEQLNKANGLVQVGASGKIPPSLNAFSSLEFIGTWDASGGTNPADGPAAPADGGQFYVINVAGTLTIFIDDSGIPVATVVEPGDYLLWVSGANSTLTPGYYLVRRETPVFIAATNVTYDPSTAPWTNTDAQEVFDEIGDRATLRDRSEAIAQTWTFNAAQIFNASATFNGNISVITAGSHIGLYDTDDIAGQYNLVERNGNAFNLYYYDGAAYSNFLQYTDAGNLGFNPGGIPALSMTTGAMNSYLPFTHAAAAVFSSTVALNGVATFSANPKLGNGIILEGVSVPLIQQNASNFVQVGTNANRTQLWGSTVDMVDSGGVLAARVTTVATGALLVASQSNVMKKAGFRNPSVVRDIAVAGALAQTDEGQIVRTTGAASFAITVNQLEEGTQITLISKMGLGFDNTIVAGAGVTLNVLGSNDLYSATGLITVERGAVIHFEFEGVSVVNIWGGGISRA